MAAKNVKITELLRDYMWNVCTRHHDYRDMKDFEAFILELRGLEYRIAEAEKTEKALRKRLAEKSVEINKLHEEIRGLEDKLVIKEADNTKFRVFDPISCQTFLYNEAEIKDIEKSINEKYREAQEVNIDDVMKDVLKELGLTEE